MGRAPRVTQAGVAYHLLNRRVMRLPLFEKDADYAACERVLREGLARADAPSLLAYCLMPNHWHLVVMARASTNLSTWMQWTTVTHTHRWHAHHHTTGEGPLYQGRFKSFPIQRDGHFLAVCRYVEANALRAKLTTRAETWRWSSLWARRNPSAALHDLLGRWPVDAPRNWLTAVNRAIQSGQITSIREAVVRGVPFGEERWKARIATRLGLQSALRPRGRPPKSAEKSS